MFGRVHLRGILAVAALAGAVALSAAPALARASRTTDAPAAAEREPAPCFFRRDWKGGWKVTPDARTVYIVVAPWIYRLDLDAPYSLLRSPWAVLLSIGSNDTMCTALDFRLSVTDRAGAWQSPIVRAVRRLTPAEAAKLPKNLRP